MHARGAVLVAGLALLVPLTAVPAGAEAPVVARHGTLTEHDQGYPRAGAPAAAQVDSARVTQDVVNARVRASVTLRAVPTDSSVDLVVGFGTTVGGRCTADESFLVNALDPAASSAGATRDGAVVTVDRPSGRAATGAWDCAAVISLTSGSRDYLDVVWGPLVPQLGVAPVPRLSVGDAAVLRRPVSRLKLVRGVWTTVDVAVTNAAGTGAEAAELVVTGSGRGLQVEPSTALSYPLSDGSTATLEVRVRLTTKGAKAGPLTLVARSGDATAQRTLPVRSVRAARAPVAGTYRATGAGKATFRVKGRAVVGFRTGRLRTRCGTPGGGPFTFLTASYAFPRTKIGRDGVVDAARRTDDSVARLQMRVVGRKVTRGWFSWTGPGGCFASVEFRAQPRSRR